MFKNKISALWVALLAISLGTVVSCVKTNFDEPPVGGDYTDIPTTTTIKALKALHTTTGGFDLLTNDDVIGGVVTLDDKSGNYYKTIVIQDTTAGIEIEFNDGYQYNQFPIGRKIYIKVKDLFLTDYNGLTKLTGGIALDGSSQGLLKVQVAQHIVKGKYDLAQIPAPKVVSPAGVNKDLISMLVRVENVEFDKADTAQVWADAITKNSQNRVVKSCGGSTLTVRSSGYADFAAQKTPTGKGNITGVLGIYGTTYQLAIRDLRDVDMTGARCGGTTGGEQLMSISEVRSLFTGTTTSAPAGRKIRGIVSSDRNGKNLNAKNLYMQDATGGIVVRFDANHTLNLGDEIEVVISDQEISEFNKLLQVNNVPAANAKVISTGNTITPRVATIAEITTNFNAWESTLVKISNCTITPTGTLSGSKNVSDGTGTIVMFTQTAATFAGNAVPTTPVTLTAIVSDFNAKQIILRNSSDIQ